MFLSQYKVDSLGALLLLAQTERQRQPPRPRRAFDRQIPIGDFVGDVESLYPRIILAEVKPDLVKQGIKVCKGC
jgi:hypothetical protein